MIDTDDEIIKNASPLRTKAKKLRVTFAGEEPICYKRATDTFMEAMKRIPEEKYSLINISHNNVNLVSRDIDAKHPNWQKPLKDGWLVMSMSSTETKYRWLITIKNQLDIDMTVEMSEDFEDAKSNPKPRKSSGTRNDVKLLVKMPDGTFIGEPSPIDTYIQTLWAIGIDDLMAKKLVLNGLNLITKTNEHKNQIQVGVDRWASFPLSTKDKVKWLKVISAFMKINMEITLL